MDAIGPEAEAFVYFYAACDRGVFYPQLASPSTQLGALSFRDRFTGSLSTPSADDVALFVDLTYANEVELGVRLARRPDRMDLVGRLLPRRRGGGPARNSSPVQPHSCNR